MAKQGFPGGGGQPNMQQLMKQAQKMQQQLMDAQAKLAASEVEGGAGNGLVTATVSGGGELLRLAVAPEVVDPEDVDTLVDLVVYAVQDAQKKAAALQNEAMGPLGGGLGGGLPGLSI
jgi:DNA-binding YbaB/EbfC family protein